MFAKLCATFMTISLGSRALLGEELQFPEPMRTQLQEQLQWLLDSPHPLHLELKQNSEDSVSVILEIKLEKNTVALEVTEFRSMLMDMKIFSTHFLSMLKNHLQVKIHQLEAYDIHFDNFNEYHLSDMKTTFTSLLKKAPPPTDHEIVYHVDRWVRAWNNFSGKNLQLQEIEATEAQGTSAISMQIGLEDKENLNIVLRQSDFEYLSRHGRFDQYLTAIFFSTATINPTIRSMMGITQRIHRIKQLGSCWDTFKAGSVPHLQSN